jgi:hypothetical protein
MLKLANERVKVDLITTAIHPIIPHICFAFLRILAFAPIFAYHISIIKYKNLKQHISISSDLTFIVQLSIFQFYMTAKALINSSIFTYHVSIALIFHNMAASLLYLATTRKILPNEFVIYLFIISLLFTLEFFYSLYILFSKKYEPKFDLFNKIGANPKINEAFGKRKCLKELGTINCFISLVIAGRNLFFQEYAMKPAYFTYIQGLLTYILQITVLVGINDENKTQRKIAFLISFIRIFVLSFIVIFTFMIRHPYEGRILSGISAISLLTCSIFYHYFLWADTQRFGSGLKVYLSFKTDRIYL